MLSADSYFFNLHVEYLFIVAGYFSLVRMSKIQSDLVVFSYIWQFTHKGIVYKKGNICLIKKVVEKSQGCAKFNF